MKRTASQTAAWTLPRLLRNHSQDDRRQTPANAQEQPSGSPGRANGAPWTNPTGAAHAGESPVLTGCHVEQTLKEPAPHQDHPAFIAD